MTRYFRQQALPEFGPESGEALTKSKVLIVGAGGLGVPVGMYLAGAGLGHITIVDGDKVELSNLHRQVAYSETDLGNKKALVLSKRLRNINSEIEVVSISKHLEHSVLKDLVPKFDLVLECSDNFSCKFMVNDACYELGVPVIIGSILRFQAQVGLFGTKELGSYRHIFPEPPEVAPTCQEAGVLGPACGVVANIQALEALKFLNCGKSSLENKFLFLSLDDLELKKIEFKADPDLLEVSCLREPEFYQSKVENIKMKLISPKELSEKQSEEFELLDVREEVEREICSIGGTHIPLGELPHRVSELDSSKPWIIYCKMGGRSAQACQFLSEHAGFSDVTNLEGGILKYQEDVDSSLKRY